MRSHYQNRCLSRFNSVKRKQLERLRQRSDWFLSPTERERNNSRKGRGEASLSMFAGGGRQSGQQCGAGGNGCKSSGCGNGSSNGNNSNNNTSSSNNHGSSKVLQQKNSGNSVVTKASSEGAVLEVFSDGDSVFTDNTSRSESPASEPVWTHAMKVHSRDIIHSDTIAELVPEMSFLGSSGADLSVHSRDNVSIHYIVDLSPSPSGRSQTIEEGYLADEQDEKDDLEDDEDAENRTPTGGQDGEEETTLVLSSLADIQHSAGDETSSRSDGTSTEKESLDDLHSKMAQSEGSDREDMGSSEVGLRPQPSSGEGESGGQQTGDIPAPPAQEEEGGMMVDREGGETLVQCYLVERTYGTDNKDS